MDGWKEGWKEGRMDGWMEGWKDGRMEGWKDGRMNRIDAIILRLRSSCTLKQVYASTLAFPSVFISTTQDQFERESFTKDLYST